MSSGQTIILGSHRDIAHRIVDCAPLGSVMAVSAPKRSDDQNARLWAMLSDVSRAKPESRNATPDVWKALFMHALDHATRFELALDGRGMVPVGFRSSRLNKQQMSDLIETIHEYAARHDVIFSDSI
jgi:hypothetical protein